MAAVEVDADRTIAQFKHTRWDRDDGVPAPIRKMVQGADGFLWLAGADGLYRFDGVTFEKVEPAGAPMHHGPAQFVTASQNGDIWTWFLESERAAVYRAGRLELLPPTPAARGTVSQMASTPDGSLWIGFGNSGAPPLLRFRDGRWASLPLESLGIAGDALESLLVAGDGALWVSYFGGGVYRMPPGAARFERVHPASQRRVQLLKDPQGRVWYIARVGAMPLSDPRGSPLREPAALAGLPDMSTGFRGGFFDSAGHLWIGTWPNGIERARVPDDASGFLLPTGAQADRYDSAHGLTADTAMDLIEDGEGNVWVSTADGLDRFRRSRAMDEPLLHPRAGFGNIYAASDDGRVFVGTLDAVYRIDPGHGPVPIAKGLADVEALCVGPDGLAWAVDARSVVALRGDQQVQVLPRPTTYSGIYGCAIDRHGVLWLSASGNGLYRLVQGRWESVPTFGPPGKDTFDPLLMTRDASGALVMMWTFRRIVRFDPPRAPETLVPEDSPIGPIGYLQAGPRGVLAVGKNGIAWVKDRTPLYLDWEHVPELRGAQGFVQTDSGHTWARTPGGIARMATQDLERAFTQPGFRPVVMLLSHADGVGGGGAGRSSPIVGGDGRIWFNAWSGSVVVNPEGLRQNTVEPKVVITGLRADGDSHRDPASLSLPAGTADIEIRYAALSLSIPERVQVRYRLEGYDDGWVDPGMRRQAFYTNLSPGKYRFHVIASNEDGIWSTTGAAVEFELPPTFLQSRTFTVLCLLVASSLVWLWVRLRTNQIAARIRSRLEERLDERERIARELHDTLLQSVYGLILYLQSLAERMPSGEPTRRMFERALDRANDVATEGRNRVQDLRATEHHGDLSDSLGTLVAQMGVADAVTVLEVEGAERPVEPAVEAELLRIVGEALVNVARHAQADRVRVTLNYGSRQLVVRVHDDGVGIAAGVLAAGHKEGHFGLVGMRERSAQIGASLSIESPGRQGTVVSITLPAALAYTNTGWRWLARLRERTGSS